MTGADKPLWIVVSEYRGEWGVKTVLGGKVLGEFYFKNEFDAKQARNLLDWTLDQLDYQGEIRLQDKAKK